MPLRSVLASALLFPWRAALAASPTPDSFEAATLAGDDECLAGDGSGRCALSALQHRAGAVRTQEGADLRRALQVTDLVPGVTDDEATISTSTTLPDPPAEPSTSKAVESNKTTTTSTTTTTTGTTTKKIAQAIYEQCGGKGYDGLTKCASGLGCVARGEYYSMCVAAIDVPFDNTPLMKEESDAPLYTFYVYRAFANQTYEAENINVASLPGVLWYLHNEVVVTSPRKFGIMQIKRYKIQTKAPKPLFDLGMNFGVRYAFDFGQCTGPWYCGQMFQKYGFFVGCNNLGDFPFPTFEIYYDDAIWYSLPAACPLKSLNDHNQQCKEGWPGGRCSGTPTGTATCTWSLEDAGEIMIDDLEGIDDYDEFVEDKNREYDPFTDQGVGLSFWNGVNNTAANTARVRKAQAMFDEKYPDDPKVEQLPPPTCDFDFDKFYGHPNPGET
mmetsp:Transcript_64410/g.168598  ORF Transcript_64410/g.168598 Transcript_64410/m.168598 type:complete len:442 (+) Transcript_64410:100-1425(+)